MKNKSCPFCGKQLDLEDPDVLYPSGTIWRFDSSLKMKTYHRRNEMKEGDNQCFGLHCPETSGGCGIEIHGDSVVEVIKKWNKRV